MWPGGAFGNLGADWVSRTTAPKNFTGFDVDTELGDATYEGASFKRIYTVFDIRRDANPDAVTRLTELARVAVLRHIGREVINATGSGADQIMGLAGYYDDQIGAAGADPQVFKTTGPCTPMCAS